MLSDFHANNKIANIGYFLNKAYWKKGIASLYISPVVDFGFNYLGLERIETRVAVDNIGSWKALEINGFIREGLLRSTFELKYEYLSGLFDCYIYSKLRTD